MKTLEFGRYVRLRVCLFMLLATCTYFCCAFPLVHGVLVLRAYVEAAEITAKQRQFGDSLGA
jgi:hypothetical protein